MYSRKRVGPSTEPCGTPEVTGEMLEWEPFIATNWVRLCWNPDIHWSIFPLTPYCQSLCSNLAWLTLSKALLKSNSSASTWPCWFKMLAQSWQVKKSCVSKDIPARNPCWIGISLLQIYWNILLYWAYQLLKQSNSWLYAWTWTCKYCWVLLNVLALPLARTEDVHQN